MERQFHENNNTVLNINISFSAINSFQFDTVGNNKTLNI